MSKNKAMPAPESALLRSVESFDDYKEYLRYRIFEARHLKGYQSLLARAASCHPSFLSQVLNTPTQLTPDHAAALAEFWELSESESEFFLCLVQLARAASPNYRGLLLRKLAQLRKEKTDLARRFQTPRLTSEQAEATYYSHWLYAAIHVLTSVPGAGRPAALAERLAIPRATAEKILGELAKMGLVEKNGAGWTATGNSLHLPKTSPHLQRHLANWRSRALIRAVDPTQASVHYSAIHGLSRSDAERLRELVVRFLEESRKVVAPSLEEDVVCLNVDYFRVE